MSDRKVGIAHTAKQGRRDRLIKEHVHDPYMIRSDFPEPTACPSCGVVYAQGRWQWMSNPPVDAHESLCPACQRIRDKAPAGILELGGDFFAAHRTDITHLVRNTVEAQKAQHPMKRMIGMEQGDDGRVVVTFTDTHLPRGVGEAIQRAYEGELDVDDTKEANLVRVSWTR